MNADPGSQLHRGDRASDTGKKDTERDTYRLFLAEQTKARDSNRHDLLSRWVQERKDKSRDERTRSTARQLSGDKPTV
jgi:hypothetical protein